MALVPVLIVSLIPALLVFFYLMGLRKDDAVYRSDCSKLLGKGLLCSVFVALLAALLNIAWSVSGLGNISPILNAFYHDFILAAFVEEFVKYKVTMKEIRKKDSELTTIDIVAYFGIVAIGFDIIESIVYFFGTNLMQIIVRGICIPHLAYGFIMGWFVSKYISTGKKSYIIPAFGIPFLIHGTYDFFLSEEIEAVNEYLGMISFLMVFIEMAVVIVTLLKIRKAKKKERSIDEGSL